VGGFVANCHTRNPPTGTDRFIFGVGQLSCLLIKYEMK
jgi:hypothetical protein